MGVLRWVGGVCRARFGSSSETPRLSITPRLLTSKKYRTPLPLPKSQSSLSQKARCAAFHRCLSAAFPRDAARLRGGVRVLCEWGLARSAPASPLARALHLLCRDARFLP